MRSQVPRGLKKIVNQGYVLKSENYVTNMRIEKLKLADVNELSRFANKIIGDCPYYSANAKRIIKREFSPVMLRAKAKSRDWLFLVAKEESMIGFCFGEFYGETYWFEWIGVDQHARGRGIATALMAEQERRVRGRRTRRLWCDCRTENTESKRLLRKMGLRRFARLDNHWYGQDFYLWEKSL